MIWGGGYAQGAATVAGDWLSYKGQQETNAMNVAEAAKNRQFQGEQAGITRDWEEKMSDTAMTRRMADNRAAGVNPLLAVSQGGASSPTASTPGGAQAHLDNPAASFGNLGSAVGQALQTAADIKLKSANANDLDASAAQKRAMTPKTSISNNPDEVLVTPLNDWQRQLAANAKQAVAQLGITEQNGQILSQQLENLKAALPGIQAQSTSAASTARVSSDMADAALAGQKIANILSTASEPQAQAIAKFYSDNGGLAAMEKSMPLLKGFFEILMAFIGHTK